MPAKSAWIAVVAALVLVAAWSLYRDIQIEQQYPADLRNRVVGARLQQEHASPYFYTWKEHDPIRFYDPNNIYNPAARLPASNITAPPFFHRLMMPLAAFQQRTISRIWLGIEYGLLALSMLIALRLAGNRSQKMMVLAVTALFLLSEAWVFHIAAGQYYLLVPFLALSCYFFLRNAHRLSYGAAAGCCAAVLVLIRPNALIFFLPLLLVLKRYPVRWLVAFFLPIVLLAGLSLANPQERALWMDYKEFLGQQIQLHQLSEIQRTPPPAYANWEGWRQSDIEASYARFPYHDHSEHANVFLLYEKIAHRKVNLTVLNTVLLVLLAALLLWFIRTGRRHAAYGLESIVLFGYCLYMLAEFFSPIWRHQYNTVQWLCPLLLAAACYTPAQKKWFALLGLGLLLNIMNTPILKMEHTLGEIIFLGVLLIISNQLLVAASPPPERSRRAPTKAR